mmetsp:Transcript_97976/g.211174  ORF Transcript_97976/g.211174 Transcript_97976/m.211174 type:complete len:298 (-) Transcript_97976:118-1011(-)
MHPLPLQLDPRSPEARRRPLHGLVHGDEEVERLVHRKAPLRVLARDDELGPEHGDAVRDLLRGQAGVAAAVDHAEPLARLHPDDLLDAGWQEEEHPVACLEAVVAREELRRRRGARQEGAARDVRTLVADVERVGLLHVRQLISSALQDVHVHLRERRVRLRAGEPLVEGLVGVVQHLLPRSPGAGVLYPLRLLRRPAAPGSTCFRAAQPGVAAGMVPPHVPRRSLLKVCGRRSAACCAMAIYRRQRRSCSVRGVPVRVPVRAIHDLPVAAVRQRAVRVPVRVPVLLGSSRFGILLL